MFPLYEVLDGRLRITRKVSTLRPVSDYFAKQGRFQHLAPEEIARIEAQVRADWQRLLAREREEGPAPA